MPPAHAGRALLLSLLLAACAGGASDAALTDSVVIDVAAAKPPSVAIDEHGEKIWSFGGLKDDPDDELQQGGIPGLILLPDGNYFMAEGFRVRVFDSDANELWRFGREGAGPEEFGALGWPCAVSGDTVVIVDQRNQRFAFIKPFEGVLSTVPAEQRSLRSGSCTGAGSYLLGTVHRGDDSSRIDLEFAGFDGVSQPAVLSVPYTSARRVGEETPAYGLVDTLIYVADRNASTIDLYDRNGGFVKHIEWQTERIPVTDENIPKRFGSFPMGRTPEGLEEWWNEVRSRPRVANWPGFLGITADGRGRLWIREEFEMEGDTTVYLVLDPLAGRIAARVAMPRASRERMVRLHQYLDDGIVLMHTDDDGATWMSVIPYPEELK